MKERQIGHTLTLDIPEDVYQALLQKAAHIGQPPEAVAVRLLAAATEHRGDDPLEPFIGAFTSHGTAWAEQHDAHLGKTIKDSMG